jgi:hypothetical protein
MRRISLIFLLLFISIFFLSACACSEKLKINVLDEEVTIDLGEEKTLNIEVNKEIVLNYESTDLEVVSVDKGVITGIGVGSAKIIVTYEEFKKEIDVTVIERYYTVTFIPDEENLHLITRVQVKKGDLVRAFVPKKEGKAFFAWYLDDEVFKFTTPITHDITLVARWENERKKITFNYNPPLNPVFITEGETYMPPAIEREFYIFQSWAYFENGNLIPITDPIIITKDLELHPLWIKNFYKITFDTKGGDVLEDVKIDKDGVLEYQVSEVASKDGYVFQYWGYYEGEKLIKVYLDQTITINKDIKLIAFYDK